MTVAVGDLSRGGWSHSEIDRGPNRLREWVEQDWEKRGGYHRGCHKRSERKFRVGKYKSDDAYGEHDDDADHGIDPEGSRKVAFDSLELQSASWTFLRHVEPVAEEVALTTYRAAAGDPTPEKPHRHHELCIARLYGELAMAETFGLHQL